MENIELIGKYTKCNIFAETVEEGVYQQVYEIINHPAFENQKVVCMPDVHVGYSGPCGLVATIGEYVCPNHIGNDIGCSVSMMILNRKIDSCNYAEVNDAIKKRIPFGSNIHNESIIDRKDFYSFLERGFNKYKQKWVERLYDLPNKVDEKWVTKQLKRLDVNENVFYNSLGTVGGGNHFIEYDEDTENNISAFTLHFGSRIFGTKVCKYWMKNCGQDLTKKEYHNFVNEFKSEYLTTHTDMRHFNDDLKAAIKSKSNCSYNGYLNGSLMDRYLCDMCFAQLYAQYNHYIVMNIIKDIIKKYSIKVLRSITSTHNYIDLEDHTLRKSAIRSYKGEEIIVPFNMRDGVAVCEGLSNGEWLNSCAHGAGRKMSRNLAKNSLKLEDFEDTMKDVYSTSVCEATIDESPMAYKDTDEIKRIIGNTCKIKYMMIPKINIKAHD